MSELKSVRSKRKVPGIRRNAARVELWHLESGGGCHWISSGNYSQKGGSDWGMFKGPGGGWRALFSPISARRLRTTRDTAAVLHAELIAPFVSATRETRDPDLVQTCLHQVSTCSGGSRCSISQRKSRLPINHRLYWIYFRRRQRKI